MERKNVVFLLLSLCFVTVVYIQSFQEVSKSFQKISFVSNKDKSRNTFNSTVGALRNNNNSDVKTILVWNARYGLKNWGFKNEPRKDFLEMGCQISNCAVTDAKTKNLSVDAILFHVAAGLQNYPLQRPKHQRWVFYESEPPCGLWPKIKLMSNEFNWTQTFRTDADIPSYYGHTCKRNKTVDVNFKNILRTKNKLVAWMVSNCKTPSKRIEYVRELMKYIQIDVYGACASRFNQNNICILRKECLNMIGRNYKFYLSFENSFSKDYVTEKFFKILNVNVVPVVRGDGNYSALGPPNSFVDTKDFTNPRKLAEYLLVLDKDNAKYLKYFEWKRDFKILNKGQNCLTNELGWCTLCKKLNNPNEPVTFYKDVRKWFGTCRKPNDINF